jgi:cell division protein FtsN
MVNKGIRQAYILGSICILFFILANSTHPVKVYRMQKAKDYHQPSEEKVVNSAKPQQPSWQWNTFYQRAATLALLGITGGILMAAFSSSRVENAGMVSAILPGAVAGLLTGIIVGSLAYLWEYSFGYEVLNTIYMLPEKAIDYNQE